MLVKLIITVAASAVLSGGLGYFLLPLLRALKAGQSIRELGPTWHNKKAGTPMMGGLMFIAAAIIWIAISIPSMQDYTVLYVLGLALCFGLIGFADDFTKIKFKRNLGLTSLQKALLQLAVSALYLYLLYRTGNLSNRLYIPFFGWTGEIHIILYIAIAMFIMVGCVNAVNLTDGVDGLASGATFPVMIFFVVVTYFWGSAYGALGVFASGLAGGLLGFLIYNFNPAKVFMGDTGSLFLGGAVAALAFAYDMPLILIVLGIVYIVETLSVIIQVGYFKLSGGKRIFKMAPFHHHLEMGGWLGHKWTEKQLFVLVVVVSTLAAVLSFMGISGRFAA